MHRSTLPEERRNAWRAIAVFLPITIVLSAVFETLMASQGEMATMLVYGVMWSPGIAALLTCLLLKRKVAGVPWSRRSSVDMRDCESVMCPAVPELSRVKDDGLRRGNRRATS